MVKKTKQKLVKHLKKIAKNMIYVAIATTPALPVSAANEADLAKEVIASEGGKEAINAALRVAKSKPALSIAASITCLACIPAAGMAASPAMCLACGILIAKTLG